MKKKIIVACFVLAAVVGVIGGIKLLQLRTLMSMEPPLMVETVTAAAVKRQQWESIMSAVGSLTAVQGVTIAAEVAGKVVDIPLEAGTMVRKGDLLVQQDVAAETAQLRSAQAAFDLAQVNFERAKKLFREETFSRSDYDNAEAQLKQAAAQVDNLKAAIHKKTMRAPFDGALGIRLVNLGQMLSAGDAIISLQSLDPVFANFALPQQHLMKLSDGLQVRIETDAAPGSVFAGTITAINPQVDETTRNIMLQATVENPDHLLRPGMFVTVSVVLPVQQPVLAIPATAVLNAPYSDSVFIIEKAPENGTGALIARQQFVRLGARRGDFVAVEDGLQEGDTIVSTGAFKLRNGQAVTIDNTLVPQFHAEPEPVDS
ncbi:MAG: efflux RND transporter periplasmic adaptor subunit [Deltaproteobacteria bacterium]|nr:efflux RND transporter periplasmic adaptor subunit [Deltaproteobacteria bacterium]